MCLKIISNVSIVTQKLFIKMEKEVSFTQFFKSMQWQGVFLTCAGRMACAWISFLWKLFPYLAGLCWRLDLCSHYSFCVAESSDDSHRSGREDKEGLVSVEGRKEATSPGICVKQKQHHRVYNWSPNKPILKAPASSIPLLTVFLW